MQTNKFNDAKEKLVLKAANYAAQYLLSKYGQAHLIGEPVVELKAVEGPVANSYAFSGTISVKADTGLLNPVVGVNMTVNSNDIEVESEESVQTRIETALRAEQTPTEQVVAALDSFKLENNGSKYLSVKHAALADASIGIVGKAEYEASKDKVALLKSIVKDAFPQIKIAFEGSFAEPVIEKVARGCDQCEATMINGVFCHETGCPNQRKERFQEEQEDIEVESKSEESWLTDIESADRPAVKCPQCEEEIWDYAGGGMTGAKLNKCWNCGTAFDAPEEEEISIKEDMPMARASDHLAQSMQLEDQLVKAAQEKINSQAVNAIIGMLNAMGYGSAKVAQVETFKEGLDIMTYLEDHGTTKAVNIPVTLKDAVVILPKRSLVASLIEKGLDINARLSEEFSKEVLSRIAAAEEKAVYEAQEALEIIAEKPVIKQASGSENEQFLGDTDTMEVQKHLIPDHEKLKKGDKISDGAEQWEIIDTEYQQNDKNENSSSIWKLKKCAPPKADSKEPETKIKA